MENLLFIVRAGADSRRLSVKGNEITFRGNRNAYVLIGVMVIKLCIS